MAVESLLQRERAARLVDQHRRDTSLPGLEDVLDGLTTTAFAAASEPERQAELRRVIQSAVVTGMVRLAEDRDAPARVRSRVDAALQALLDRLRAAPGTPSRAHDAFLQRELEAHFRRPRDPSPVPPTALPPPPGEPIGDRSMLGDCGFGG